ncbi:uncharacterized protein [Primulina huaijiensis]|uniref:uncharacterized protein n=1 Tax=Primulina huaijiensis TaxID=1492673 RepID=UPI003CC6E4A0
MMNPYNPTTLLGWRANVDMSPCTSIQAVVAYLVKYCSKDEPNTATYNDITRSLLPYLSHRQPDLSYASKLMNRLIGERDWSAQEVSHVLFGLPLHRGSRQSVTLDCRKESDIGRTVELDESGVEQRSGKHLLEKYETRDPEYENATLFQFLTNFEHTRGKVHKPRPRAKNRVIIYSPRYDASPGNVQYEDYCRLKIALHHPFRKYPTLPWNGNETWAAALDGCRSLCDTHPHDYVEDPSLLQQERDDEDEFVPEDIPLDIEQGPELLAGETAARNPAQQAEDPDNLGQRQVDRQYLWEFHVSTYVEHGSGLGVTIYDGQNWWKRAKELYKIPPRVRWQSQGVVDRLAAEQRIIYDKVISHYRAILAGQDPPPFLLNVDGRAGTGKSFVIQVLSAHLQELSHKEVIIRCAPTGAASFGIAGSTMHSIFKLPVGHNIAFGPLNAAQAAALQARLANVQYIILDEKSYVAI